jgi:starvation-inducible DNA-binding protein
MYPTKNDLPEATRVQMIEVLNLRLADAIALQTQSKQAHWNVKGPNFIALHLLFDQISDATLKYIDLIAERAVQLGGIAEGTAKMAVQRARNSNPIHSIFQPAETIVKRCRQPSPLLPRGCAKASMPQMKPATKALRISTPKSRVARMNGSGSLNRIYKPRLKV